MINQAILDAGGKHAVGMLLPLLIALVIQGAAAKEQDAHGKRQDKAEHIEHKGSVEQHRPLDAAERHGTDRQCDSPCGPANHHATAYDFKAIDQQKADEQHRQDADDVVNADQQQAQQKEQHRRERAIVDNRPYMLKKSIGHLKRPPVAICHIRFPHKQRLYSMM